MGANIEPKVKKIKRSRTGCHNCKRLKIKCDEMRPSCSNCVKTEVVCDYSIKLIWGGRPYKNTKKREKYDKKNGFTDGSVPQCFQKSSGVPMQSQPAPSSISFVVEAGAKADNSINNEVVTMGGSHSEMQLNPQTDKGANLQNINLEMQRSITEPTISDISAAKSQVQTMNEPFFSSFAIGGDPYHKFNNDKFSITDHYPGISDGIESLSQALENIASGGNTFSLQNSEIFNTFVISNIEDKSKDDDSFINFQNEPVSEYFHVGYNHEPNNNVNFAALSPPVSNNTKGDERMEQISNSNTGTNPISPGNDLKSTTPPQLPHIAPLQTRSDYNLPTITSVKPAVLLQNPYFKELLDYWIDVAADNLVPAPSTIYTENPFKVILPRMAMEAPSIMTTLLAFAASVRSQFTLVEEPRKIIDQLLASSCTELLKLLQDKSTATSDITLATVLLLSCLESFISGNFDRHRSHALGARQIILSRGLRMPTDPQLRSFEDEAKLAEEEEEEEEHNEEEESKEHKKEKVQNEEDNKQEDEKDRDEKLFTPKNTLANTPSGSISSSNSSTTRSEPYSTSESDIPYFLMRWFAYLDVIGALSATKKSENYLSYKNYANFFENDSGEVHTNGDIDRLFGFDIAFLPYLAKIAILIRQTNKHFENKQESAGLPSTILTKALEVKESWWRVFSIGEEKRQSRLEKMIESKNRQSHKTKGMPANVTKIIERDRIMRSINKLWYNMGLLNIYRRVMRINRNSYLVQDLCKEIGDTLQLNIEPKSPAEICSIFCTFCAACETTDILMQQLFHARFSTLTEIGLANAKKGLQIMTRCWETGQDWMYCAKELNIDLTLL